MQKSFDSDVAHGQFDVSSHGQIILVKLAGSFNCAAIKAYAQAVKDKIAGLKGQEFAMLINDVNVEGGTPEAYDALNDYNAWLNEQAIVAKAFILSSLALKDIILKRTPELQHQNIAFFESSNTAITWLEQQLEIGVNNTAEEMIKNG